MIKQYPKHNGTEEERGFTADEIRRGVHAIYQDYICPKCNKVQPVAIGNICNGCGYKYE